YPFLLDDLDWSSFDRNNAGSLTHLQELGESIRDSSCSRIIAPLHVGNNNHFAAVEIDFAKRTISYGDSLEFAPKDLDVRGIRTFSEKLNTTLDAIIETLPHSMQDDGFSCPDCTWNTSERALWPATHPWSPPTKHLERAEYALLLATQLAGAYTLSDFGLTDDIIRSRHDGRRRAATLTRSRSHTYDSPSTPSTDMDGSSEFELVGYESSDDGDSGCHHIGDSKSDLRESTDGDTIEIPSSPSSDLCSTSPETTFPTRLTLPDRPALSQVSRAQHTKLTDYFVPISRAEAEKIRLATARQRKEDEADQIKFVQQREEMKRLGKQERKRQQNRERKRRQRERLRAEKKQARLLDMNAVLGQPHQDTSAASSNPAEKSRPYREFKELAREDRDPRGRKRKHGAQVAKRENWTNPLLFEQIINAGREAGPHLSATEIVKILQRRNPVHFARLTSQVLGRYIERPIDGLPRWKESILQRVEHGMKPGGQTTRSGVLSNRPELVELIKTQLTLLRKAGIPVNVRSARGIMLAHIEHHAPELLHATAQDGSHFRCSDAYVRKFLYEHLRWVPRTPTRTAQNTPDDVVEKLWELFLRLALVIRDAGIRHPALVVNFDQTGVIVASTDSRTFEVEGSKQVSVVNKEEKRAWTAVVAVSANGDVLPTQIVMKGGTERSLPSSKSSCYAEAKDLGFIFSYNPANYWSSLPLMEEYLDKIVVPFFTRQKASFGYPEDQECIVLLDCWSVHRSQDFRELVRRRWPWNRLQYVPGGMTGLAQPCDVGIQRPYKLSIKKSQLQDIIDETLSHLEDGGQASDLQLDTRIGTLRNRSVSWFVKAWHDINHADFVKKAFEHCIVRDGFNLSFESLISPAALKVLRELPCTDKELWAKISGMSSDELDNDGDMPESGINLSKDDNECPFSEEDLDDGSDDSALEPSVLMAQMLSVAVDADQVPGLADELEPGEVAVPNPEDLGRGKRRKLANKKCAGFINH
ncbi:hypothetical protein EWM64_g8344, partial [Hericium alpestre]